MCRSSISVESYDNFTGPENYLVGDLGSGWGLSTGSDSSLSYSSSLLFMDVSSCEWIRYYEDLCAHSCFRNSPRTARDGLNSASLVLPSRLMLLVSSTRAFPDLNLDCGVCVCVCVDDVVFKNHSSVPPGSM